MYITLEYSAMHLFSSLLLLPIQFAMSQCLYMECHPDVPVLTILPSSI